MQRHTFLARYAPTNPWRLVYEEKDWTPEDVEAETRAAYSYPWPGNRPEYQPIFYTVPLAPALEDAMRVYTANFGNWLFKKLRAEWIARGGKT